MSHEPLVEPAGCLNCGSETCLRAECMADQLDIVIFTTNDGRRVMSVNGQGHFPVDG